jgi:hypothetical protein
MKLTSILRFLLVFVALLTFGALAFAGGWDNITVKDFPDFAVAGKPLNLTFKVWFPRDGPGDWTESSLFNQDEPSPDPVTGPPPVVRATHAKAPEITAIANGAPAPGQFTATLVLPEAGDWVIAIDTSYKNAATMPPLHVIAPGKPQPAPLSLADRGLRLFTVKGCNGCHIHPEVKPGRLYGPDLTGKRFAAEYLHRFLANPSITPVPEEVCSKDRSICGSPYEMPNLNLTNSEIEALVAFLLKK